MVKDNQILGDLFPLSETPEKFYVKTNEKVFMKTYSPKIDAYAKKKGHFKITDEPAGCSLTIARHYVPLHAETVQNSLKEIEFGWTIVHVLEGSFDIFTVKGSNTYSYLKSKFNYDLSESCSEIGAAVLDKNKQIPAACEGVTVDHKTLKKGTFTVIKPGCVYTSQMYNITYILLCQDFFHVQSERLFGSFGV